MNRKSFFRNLFLSGAGVFLVHYRTKSETLRTKQKIKLATIFIAGFPYYDGPEAYGLLEVGMPLQLNRQPHNRFDNNGIEIFSGDAKLGYIPRAENITIAELMDKGIEVQAEIKELNQDINYFGEIKVEVWYERAISPNLH